jgi:hypothetical protein
LYVLKLRQATVGAGPRFQKEHVFSRGRVIQSSEGSLGVDEQWADSEKTTRSISSNLGMKIENVHLDPWP